MLTPRETVALGAPSSCAGVCLAAEGRRGAAEAGARPDASLWNATSDVASSL